MLAGSGLVTGGARPDTALSCRAAQSSRHGIMQRAGLHMRGACTHPLAAHAVLQDRFKHSPAMLIWLSTCLWAETARLRAPPPTGKGKLGGVV